MSEKDPFSSWSERPDQLFRSRKKSHTSSTLQPQLQDQIATKPSEDQGLFDNHLSVPPPASSFPVSPSSQGFSSSLRNQNSNSSDLDLFEEGEDESIGLLIGPSRKSRIRKDSYSSFGSSVLPPSFQPNNHHHHQRNHHNSVGYMAAGPTYHQRGSVKSSTTKRYNQNLAVASSSSEAQGSKARRRQSVASQGNSPSGLEKWLRSQSVDLSSHDVEADQQRVVDQPETLFQVTPSASFQSFAPPGRVRKVTETNNDKGTLESRRSNAFSDTGSTQARYRRERGDEETGGTVGGLETRAQGRGSTSGWSAGVMSAGAVPAAGGSRRRGRDNQQRAGSGFRMLVESSRLLDGIDQGDAGEDLVTKAGVEFGREAESRRFDSIQEWRVKNTLAGDASANGTSVERAGVERAPVKWSGKDEKAQLNDRACNIDALLAGSGLKSRSRTGSVHGQGNARTASAAVARSTTESVGRRSVSREPHLQLGAKFSSANYDGLGLAVTGFHTQEDTPIRRMVKYLSKENLKNQMVPMVLAFTFLIKWMVSSGDWSGRDKPPMFGDFEAQRHWIELTLNLPTSKWYFYDLEYWGLDYPPLTAWVSLLCGYFSRMVPSIKGGFDLDSSRGDEDGSLVLFMRSSVIALDFLIYVPAIIFFLSRKLEGRGKRTQTISIFTILLQPALILVDNGHFQYNSVMLGFAALSFGFLYTTLPSPGVKEDDSSTSLKAGVLTKGKVEQVFEGGVGKAKRKITDLSRRLSYDYIWSALFFCLSLSFKQMALYYAPAIFAVMLGRCWGLSKVDVGRGLNLFLGLGITVTVTLGTVFSPWLTSTFQAGQVIHRIFPLARGLFEDKVSNIWCFISVLPLPSKYKLRNLLSVKALARLSLLTTLISILPGCIMLFNAAAETARMEMMVDDERIVYDAVARSTKASSVAGEDPPSERGGRQMRSTTKSVNDGAAAATVPPSPHPSTNPMKSSPSDLQSVLSGKSGRIVEAGEEGGAAGFLPSGKEPSSRTLAMRTSKRPLAANYGGRREKAVASTLPSPAANMLLYGLLSTSMAFFLFGFQTHEKSILLPLLPLTLLMTAKGDTWGGGSNESDWQWAALGNNVAAFSMFPLLQRDGQALEYMSLNLLWNHLVGIDLFPASNALASFLPKRRGSSGRSRPNSQNSTNLSKLQTLVHLAILLLHSTQTLLELLPPLRTLVEGGRFGILKRYPDLFPVLNVLLTTPLFLLIWLWSLKRQVEVGFASGLKGSGLLGGGGGGGGDK
ncbi:hypothetical protein IE53DRAFT_384370 [Violaceomyces palustris]|uniref:Uncharacterized protein n=1 Tax=Violaceomyces palustris TaxID=1673888 RepID=A0ACD0P591_9BASI|nr:hypothetical protein IE53DRAFT_384370 [Violaceomyces palustris]